MKFLSQINVNTEYTLPIVDGTNGQVLATDGNGTAYWGSISAGATNLDALTDVIITSPSSGQLLRYGIPPGSGEAQPVWYNFTPNYLTPSSSIDNLGDVTITSAAAGQVLQWNGTAWVNATPSTAEYTSKVQHLVKCGVAVTKGQAVYVTSADGTNMIVGLASNATEATSSKTMGLAVSTGAINDQIYVVTEGLIAGLDTSTASAGDPVWLGTGGNLIFGLLNKPVAPAHLVFIGIVTRVQQNNGEIFVKVQNGFELNELHDVLISSPSTGQLIRRDSDGLWKNWSPNFLTSYTETDPIFSASAAAGITSTNITNWNTAYNDSIRAVAFNTTNGILTLTQQDAGTLTVDLDGRYLTSFSESDPVFEASAAAGITNEDIAFWDTAYGWGNHADAGYLTSFTEADTLATVAARGNISNTKLQIRTAGNAAGGNLQLGPYSDGASKWAYITAQHYNSSTEPEGFTLIGGLAQSGQNAVVIGGNIYESNPATEIQFWTHTSDTHSTGGTQRGVINSSGNWGVGTISPSYRLHVSSSAGAGDYVAYIQNTGAGNGLKIYNADWDITDYLLYTSNGGGYVTVIDGNGRLGVGTANPSYKLDVSGDSRTTGIHYVNNYLVTSTIYSGGGSVTFGNNVVIDSPSAWNDTTPMLNVGGSGDGRIQVRHIWGKLDSNTGPDNLWLQYGNTGKHVQIGDGGGGNNLYVSGDIYANGYLSGNLVATRAWVQAQGYLTSDTDAQTLSYDQGAKEITISNGNSITLDNLATEDYVNSQGFITSVPTPTKLVSPNGATVVAADSAIPDAGHSFIHTLALGPGGNDGHILGMTWAGTTSIYGAQIFLDTDPNDIMAIRSRSSAGVWTSWKTVIHSGTIGSQSVAYATSAGNADTLDSYHASSFLRSDAYNSNYGGLQVFRNIGTNTGSWPDADHTFGLENSDAGYIAINFHRAGYTSNNLLYTGSSFRFDLALESTGVITASGGNSGQWNTAYGWGNHASAGYITASYLDDYTRGSYRVIADYGGHTTWYIRSNGQFIWGSGHDWTASFRLSLPGYGGNAEWAYFGQQDSNATNGTWRGVRIRKYASGAATDGDISAAAYYIGDTRKDGNWDTAYSWGNHADAPYWNVSLNQDIQVEAQNVTFAGNVIIQGSLTESSSIRFKENIQPLEPSLTKVEQLNPVTYTKIATQEEEIGLIAEEVAELFPEVVTYNENGQPQGIQYQRLSVILLKAVQELTERVNKLENK